MKNLGKTILTVVAVGLLSCGLFCQKAQATLITGQIGLVGAATLDSSDFTMATKVTSFSNVSVSTDSGSFASIPTNGTATINMPGPWVFIPSQATMPLWQVSFGANSFTFDLATITSVTPFTMGGLNFLAVTGTGEVSGAGFAPTTATWSFSVSSGPGSTGNTFPFESFTISTDHAAPDGGATAALLGLALAGIEVIRRKFKTA
jgi:hypothetical protein